MKDLYKKIWHDPVFSKVIASLIVFLAGVAYSLIKNWIDGTKNAKQAIQNVFEYKVNLWIAIGIGLAIWIISGVVKRIRDKKALIPFPPFVNGFTSGIYQGQKWQWRWQWSNTEGFYYITDLRIVCPACHEGLLTLGYMDYSCGKCGANIPYSLLNTSNEAVLNQILKDARQKYGNCSDYIGQLAKEYIKG